MGRNGLDKLSIYGKTRNKTDKTLIKKMYEQQVQKYQNFEKKELWHPFIKKVLREIINEYRGTMLSRKLRKVMSRIIWKMRISPSDNRKYVYVTAYYLPQESMYENICIIIKINKLQR